MNESGCTPHCESRPALPERRHVRALNGTGIFLHTGLGRAPFSRDMAEDLARSVAGYTVVEIDPSTGERGLREEAVVALLRRLTSAAAATVVNNNAAAVLLAASVLARGGEVVVSRGELVEIGGGFRMPEVLLCSGAALRAVGTTNCTRIEDFEAALSPRTRLLMRVHASNYRVTGERVQPVRKELVALGRARGVPVVEDLGSGLFGRHGVSCLVDEPTVEEALDDGVDLVTFSGDKLLGGPQSGLILGAPELVARLRADPLFRAVRPDKIALALLEQVLRRYLVPPGAFPDLPFFHAFSRDAGALEQAAVRLAAALAGSCRSGRFRVEPSEAMVGSGSVPARPVASFAVAAELEGLKAGELAARLRAGQPPLYATVRGAAVRVDVMAILPGDDEAVIACFKKAEGDR